MPEPCSIDKHEKENKKYTMAPEPEPVFYQKVYNHCILKFWCSVFHSMLPEF